MLFIVTNVVLTLMKTNRTLIYIAGPTGVGKTVFSIELAKELKTEIIHRLKASLTNYEK